MQRRPGMPPEPTSRVAQAVRLLLLALACGAAVFAFARGGPDRGAVRAGYACPMHREVTSASPGSCPICGMELKSLAVERTALAPATQGPLRLPPGAVDAARPRVYSFPIHAPASVGAGGLVEAVVYDDDVATLVAGEQGLFRPAGAPATTFSVRLADRPAAPWDASTSRVQFLLPLTVDAPARGTVGWVELPERSRPALVVPSTAVLEVGDGSQVLVPVHGGAAFERRPVKLGRMPFGLAVVVSGLSPNERVAVRSAFFLDAERRLGAGADAAGR